MNMVTWLFSTRDCWQIGYEKNGSKNDDFGCIQGNVMVPKQDDGHISSLTIILLSSRTHFATYTCTSAPTKVMVSRAGDPLLRCCYPDLNVYVPRRDTPSGRT